MKLGTSVLLEIMASFQDAILQEKDISDLLREIDTVEKEGKLELSPEYIAAHPRAGAWQVN